MAGIFTLSSPLCCVSKRKPKYGRVFQYTLRVASVPGNWSSTSTDGYLLFSPVMLRYFRSLARIILSYITI